jgi:BirA family biotin operon repressor/biotin-[acetyl-CoA-carboxylase] ligase
MTDRPRLAPGYELVAFERLGSTNEEAKRRAEAGAAELTLVWAREQSAGKGRRGRAWISPRGNLYLSLVLRPDCALGAAAQLGQVAAVAVGDALEAILPPATSILLKWPNDVLVDGKKAGGILLESSATASGRVDWLVLGLGVNVESAPEGTEFPATSLRQSSQEPILVEVVLAGFCSAFHRWFARWRAEGFAPIRRAWLDRAWRLGERIEVRIDPSPIEGVFRDLDGDGALMLETAGGTKRVTAADVFAFSETA